MSTMKSATSGRKRIILASGGLLVVAGLATAAAFTDFANLNLGSGTDDSGIGGNNRFNIQVVKTDPLGNPVPGAWQEANTPEGVSINIPGADTITPGDTISVDIPFRNESPVLSADIDFKLQDRPNHVSSPEMRNALDYTVTLDGTELVTNVSQDEVNDLDLGTYTSAKESVLKLTITLPDQGSEEANNALMEKVSYVQANFHASSVKP
ncbi:hypothetical protein ACXR2W_11565 [Leucobacter sp. HY1908]